MTLMPKTLGAVAVFTILAACVEDGGTVASAPTPAEQACLRDVARTTNNSDVRVLNSSFSEAGTLVNIGVGPTGTWSCIAYQDGTTAGIQSTTNEGFL